MCEISITKLSLGSRKQVLQTLSYLYLKNITFVFLNHFLLSIYVQILNNHVSMYSLLKDYTSLLN